MTSDVTWDLRLVLFVTCRCQSRVIHAGVRACVRASERAFVLLLPLVLFMYCVHEMDDVRIYTHAFL